MSQENQLRRSFLATISIGIALVTAYAIADPQVGNRQVADFNFPNEIPLTNWQNLSSESLNASTKRSETGLRSKIAAAKKYLYQKNELNLSLEVRYLIGTRGNLSSLLTEYLEFSPKLMATQKLRTISNFGSYLLIQEPNINNSRYYNNYLTSCITPFGQSIADQKEFSVVLNQVKLTPKLFWNWLWGKESIRDRRCLWINLTIINENRPLRTSSADLEQVWIELNQWGKTNFPQL